MLGSSRAFSFQSYLNPSLLRRQPLIGAHRPLSSFESGVPAASTFCESLADADDAALMLLINEPHQWITKTSFRGSLFFITVILSTFCPLFMDKMFIFRFPSIKEPIFMDRRLKMSMISIKSPLFMDRYIDSSLICAV